MLQMSQASEILPPLLQSSSSIETRHASFSAPRPSLESDGYSGLTLGCGGRSMLRAVTASFWTWRVLAMMLRSSLNRGVRHHLGGRPADRQRSYARIPVRMGRMRLEEPPSSVAPLL